MLFASSGLCRYGCLTRARAATPQARCATAPHARRGRRSGAKPPTEGCPSTCLTWTSQTPRGQPVVAPARFGCAARGLACSTFCRLKQRIPPPLPPPAPHSCTRCVQECTRIAAASGQQENPCHPAVSNGDRRRGLCGACGATTHPGVRHWDQANPPPFLNTAATPNAGSGSGAIDVLVNNAGVGGKVAPAEDCELGGTPPFWPGRADASLCARAPGTWLGQWSGARRRSRTAAATPRTRVSARARAHTHMSLVRPSGVAWRCLQLTVLRRALLDFERIMETNYLAAVRMSKLVLPQMRARGAGQVSTAPVRRRRRALRCCTRAVPAPRRHGPIRASPLAAQACCAPHTRPAATRPPPQPAAPRPKTARDAAHLVATARCQPARGPML